MAILKEKSAIQELFFDYPPYRYIKDNKLRILVIGSDDVAVCFIDYCVQNCIFLTDVATSITIVSDGKVEKEDMQNRFDRIRSNAVSPDVNIAEIFYEDECPSDFDGYDYVFVAGQSYDENKNIAYDKYSETTFIAYLADLRDEQIDENILPVIIKDSGHINPQLERIAENFHFLWSNPHNTAEEFKKEFHNEYNYDSSISSAVSLGFKLYSLECSVEECTIEAYRKAAKECEVKLENDEKRNKLIRLEHNRWVIEKLLDGWSGLRIKKGKYVFSDCVTGTSWKNSERKIHPCIVEFDKLEDVSKQMNEFFGKKMKQIDKASVIKKVKALERLMQRDMYFEFYYLVESALNSDRISTNQISSTAERIKKATKGNEDDVLINSIMEELFPVIMFNEHKDFTKINDDAICYIPFVLSFSSNFVLVLPLSTSAQSNVDVKYLPLMNRLRADEVVFIGNDSRNASISQFYKSLGYPNVCVKSNYENDKPIIEILPENSFSGHFGEGSCCALDSNNIDFRFSNDNHPLAWLKYVPKRGAFLSIETVLKANGISRLENEIISVLDEKNRNDIFGCYFTAGPSCWNYFVSKIMLLRNDLSDIKERIVVDKEFSQAELNEGFTEQKHFIPPEYMANLSLILKAFQKQGAVDRKRQSLENGAYCLELRALPFVHNIVNELLFEKGLYLNEQCHIKQITIDENGNLSDYIAEDIIINRIIFVYDSLNIVSDYFNNRKNLRQEPCKSLIDNSYILSNNNLYRFSSYKVKQLFDKEGNILENYLYSKAIFSGDFDDVIPSCQIKYTDNRGNIKHHEIDCILTRNNKTLLVECKNKKNLREENGEYEEYQQIERATEKFSMGNIIKCIIHYDDNVDTEKLHYADNGIITINSVDAIKNIDKALADIADGKANIDSQTGILQY